MVRDGRLLVRLQIGHRSTLLEPPLPNGHTHRWTVYVQSIDGHDFVDKSFVEKVLFVLHDTFPNNKRTVKEPPFELTETGYAGFTIPLSIWLAGKQYKVQYDLNLTMEKNAKYNITTTISIGEYTPEFYSIAKKFGAEKVKRSRDSELLGIPGLDGPPSVSPPPEKIRKKERSADVSARSSPVPPIDRLKLRLDERDRDLRKAESSISPPIRAPAKREPTVTPPLPLTGGGGGEGKERKKKDNKLLGFVLDRERPSPSPSPAVVEKLKREERKKEPRGSASPSTSTSAVERLKKEEKMRDKAGPSTSTPTTAEEWKKKNLERKAEKEKEKEKSRVTSVERKREKEKQLALPSPPDREAEKKPEKRKEKEKDADRLSGISPPDKPKERKEKKEKDESRPSSAAGMAVERLKKEERKEKEKDPPSLKADSSPATVSSASRKEKTKESERERKKEKLKDRDRPPKDSPLAVALLPSTMTSSTAAAASDRSMTSLSVSVRPDKERERKNPPSITPPPVLTRQEVAAQSASGTSGRSTSPPTLVAMGNGRLSDYASSSSRPPVSAYGASTVAASSSASALPSLLQQPSPCSSVGGRETPSEKASGRSSISPGLRNEETASSGGSSASSHSSERREQKRIPKLAPSMREREAMSAPLVSIDAATVRRRIDSLTDEDKVFEIALLLLDLDDTSQICDSRSALPTLTYDLSRLDQKDLLRLDSVLSGS